MKYVGRNITHTPEGKHILTTEVGGKLQLVSHNSEPQALATLRRMLRNGYHYFDAHKDITL